MGSYHISGKYNKINNHIEPVVKKSEPTIKPKVLFITNKRSLPYSDLPYNSSTKHLDSGLSNSIRYVVSMLINLDYESKYVQVIDANCIDKEIHNYKPDIVILESLWVTPEKLNELVNLYPKIKWYIRIHSELPFLANEGIAMQWLFEYVKINNVYVSANSRRICEELQFLLKNKTFFLPNYYEEKVIENKKEINNDVIEISCFGAIRPMKNQLLQAVAAIMFAYKIHKKLKFHINTNREETGGNQVLKNIRNLFANTPNSELIEHSWTNHKEFIEIISSIDFGMQISFSETFNLVTADMVNCHVPVIVSHEIGWLDSDIKVDPTNVNEIVSKMENIWKDKEKMITKNIIKLREYNEVSEKTWLEFLK